jgi:membrane protein
VYLSWIVVLLGAVFTYSLTTACEARDNAYKAATESLEKAAE